MRDWRIVFAESNLWAGPTVVGSHHYARCFLGRGHRVFWISEFLHPFSLVRGKEAAWQMYRSWRRGPVSPEPGLLTYTPFSPVPYLPYPILSSRMMASLRPLLSIPSLGGILNRYGFRNVDVLWMTNPGLAPLARMIECRAVVYRMADRNDLYARSPLSITQLEDAIMDRADVIIVTARGLKERVPRHCTEKVLYLPNGVDFSHFAKSDCTVPNEFSGIPSPRVVFVGSIADWVDIDLVSRLAEERPQYSFVLIGPIDTDIGRLEGMPNVFLLGARSYQSLPCYLQHSHVGLIPFKVNELTQCVSPIKLFEYCACGLPVVSTRLVEIGNTNSPALLVRGHREFAEAIDRALEMRNQARRRQSVSFAERNSWQARTKRIYGIIESLVH